MLPPTGGGREGRGVGGSIRRRRREAGVVVPEQHRVESPPRRSVAQARHRGYNRPPSLSPVRTSAADANADAVTSSATAAATTAGFYPVHHPPTVTVVQAVTVAIVIAFFFFVVVVAVGVVIIFSAAVPLPVLALPPLSPRKSVWVR